jgi:mannose-6-phosphate isomerase-like protein (cupin superfamily)
MPIHPLTPAYEVRRLTELVRALALKHKLKARDSWSRSEIEALQRRRLRETVTHAVAHSRFYRELYASISEPGTAELDCFPVVTKTQLMERFDDWVTDPRLELSDLRDHIATFRGLDGHYLHRYRVLTTSGSSGDQGVFAFAGREWSALEAQLLRSMDVIGVGFRFRLGPRMRCASVFAGRPLHIASRLGASFDVGATKIAPDYRSPVAHSHREQEEAYVVVEGSGRVRLDDQVRDLSLWDVLRVAPEVVRAFEAGPDGIGIIAIGGPKPEGGDGVRSDAPWPDQ